MTTFQLNFQSSNHMGVRRSLFGKIGWGSRYWNPREARLFWWELPGEQGRFRERKNTFDELTVAGFLQNVLHLHQQR